MSTTNPTSDDISCVLEMFSESQDQHHALAFALLTSLTPKDPKNPPEGHPLTAWRLAQILYENLSDTSDLVMAASMLGVAA